MKKILIAVSAFALFATVSGVARADDAKAPAPAKTAKKGKTDKAADGTATTDTKTETKKEAPAKK